MSTQTIRSQPSRWLRWGIEFVTTSWEIELLLTLSSAGPLRMPCVTRAMTRVAPAASRCFAARQIVPHVSACRFRQSLHETRERGADHVVDEDGDLALYAADEDHPRDLVCLFALLVEERKVEV